MGNELTDILRREKGESPQDHYRRLVSYRDEFESTFRSVKGEAASAETEREMDRRRKRDEDRRSKKIPEGGE